MVLPLGDVERTHITPLGTYVLIAINIVMFIVQMQKDAGTRGEFTAAFAATPYEISHLEDITEPIIIHPDQNRVGVDRFGRVVVPKARAIPQGPVPFPVWVTLITSMFLHGGLLHLGGNMLYLWIFGDNVEEVLGTFRYLVVYLCCGLAGSLLQIAANPNSVIPTLGASGAIAGVMGMYLIWFPFNRVRVLIFHFITEVPAVLVLGLWIVLQVWSGAGSFSRVGQTGGVAYLAHVGGAVAGIIVAFMFRREARSWSHEPTFFDIIQR